MPQLVVAAVTAVAGYVAGATATAILVDVMTSVAITVIAGALFKPKMPNAKAPSRIEAAERTEVVKSSVSPHRIIYGECVVGGTLVFGHVTGEGNDKYMHLVIVVSGREVTAMPRLWVNDTIINENWIDSEGNVLVDPYEDHLRIRRHLGSPNQYADSRLVAECPGIWTSNHRLRGRAYIYVRLKRNPDVFPQGIPLFKVLVRGCRIYDPRRQGWDQELNDPSTWTYQNNPALVIMDYLRWENGLGCSEDLIDTDSFTADASVCNEDVGRGYNRPRFLCNGSFTVDRSPIDILEELVSSYAGTCVWEMGSWTSHVGAAEASTFSLTEGDLRGPVLFANKAGRSERYNAVKGTFTSPSDWAPTDFPPVTNALYEQEDGGVRVYKDVDLPFCTDEVEAQRNAKIDLETHRQGITATLPLKLRAGLPLRVLNVGSVTILSLGWDQKLFRVHDWSLVKDASGAIGIDVLVREYADAIFDWNNGEATETDIAPNLNSIDPTIVGTVSDLDAVFSGIVDVFFSRPKIDISWSTPTEGTIRGQEFMFRVSGDDWGRIEVIDPDVDTVRVIGSNAEHYYDFRVRVINDFNVVGEWVELLNHHIDY